MSGLCTQVHGACCDVLKVYLEEMMTKMQEGTNLNFIFLMCLAYRPEYCQVEG